MVVVGAGLAGATIAALSAGRGYRVRVLDNGGRAGNSGAEALPAGVHSVLEELGLREQIVAAGARRSEYAVLDWGNGSAPWRSPVTGPGSYDHGYHVDYAALVELIRRRAGELGATLEPSVTVTGPVVSNDVVTGVYVRDRGSDDGTHRIPARFVVDASGEDRVIAGGFGDRVSDPASTRHVHRTRLSPEQATGEPEVFHTEAQADGALWRWVLPCADYVEVGQLRRPEQDRDSTCTVWTTWSSQRIAGPGWLAVGDAAGVSDPLFLSPATVALLAAQAAAEMLHSVLSGLADGVEMSARYVDAYTETLRCTREFAAFCLDPSRQRQTEAELVRDLTGMLNSREFGPALGRTRRALEGNGPLFDCECPEGPLVSALEMPLPRG